MSYQEFLSFERRGAVGIVRLARPEKLNTISAPFYEAMIELQQTEIVAITTCAPLRCWQTAGTSPPASTSITPKR